MDNKKDSEIKNKVSKAKAIPKQLDIHYVKTSNYRTFYIDGLFGGLTPNGKIYMETFLQRQPTPQLIQHAINEDGTLGKELKRIGKEGFIREIEAGMVFDLQTAKIMIEWLQSQVKEFEEQHAKQVKH